MENVIYGRLKNDLAFIIDDLILALTEHQTTINYNMPVRMLCYISETFWKMLKKRDLYGPALQETPLPEFYVFYDGEREWSGQDEFVLNLSDAFKIKPVTGITLELKVRVIDINYARHSPFLERCTCMKEYSYFIYTARKYRSEGMDYDTAVAKSIQHCISKGVMVDFLKEYGEEVQSMFTQQLSLEEIIELEVEFARDQAIKEGLEEGRKTGLEEGRKTGHAEGHAEGLKEGHAQERQEMISNMKAVGIAIEQIMAASGWSREQIEAL